MKTCFLFYSYVYINCQQKDALVYNTISRQSVIIENEVLVNCLSRIAFHATSYYIISISEDNIDDNVLGVLYSLENGFYGEILRKPYKNLPIQLSPRIMIRDRDIEIYDGDEETIKKFISDIEEYNDHIGRNILTNILEMTIHYSTLSVFNHIDNYRKAFLQYHFPKTGEREIMSLDTLKKVFSCDIPTLGRINLILGTLSKKDITELFEDVIPLLKMYSNEIFLYISLSDYKKIENCSEVQLKHVYVWCHPYDNMNGELNKESVSIISLVTNNKEILYLEENFSFVNDYFPLYTGANEEFCREQLSFNTSEIQNLNLTERRIVQNKYINSNFWGELTILPNGDVFSCVNCRYIGNVNSDSMRQIIWKELNISKNWFMTRKKVETCMNCKYNWLCPPITNIELVLDNWTLCK